MNTPAATKAYVIAHLSDLDFGDAIIEYMQRIDAALAPYDGHYVVHGGDLEMIEGDFGGDLIIIGFPSRKAARAEILALRTEHGTSLVGLLSGVSPGHQATDKLAELLGQAS